MGAFLVRVRIEVDGFKFIDFATNFDNRGKSFAGLPPPSW